MNEMGELYSTLYRKPSAGNSLLHASSSHPEQLINSIPYSQLLRIKRNCTLDEDFQKEADLLRNRLLIRGYSKTNLKKAFNRVKNLNRHSLIYKTRQERSSTSTRVITKFNRQHAKVRTIYNIFWYLLTADQRISRFIKSYPEITYKRSRLLRDTHLEVKSLHK